MMSSVARRTTTPKALGPEVGCVKTYLLTIHHVSLVYNREISRPELVKITVDYVENSELSL